MFAFHFLFQFTSVISRYVCGRKSVFRETNSTSLTQRLEAIRAQFTAAQFGTVLQELIGPPMAGGGGPVLDFDGGSQPPVP